MSNPNSSLASFAPLGKIGEGAYSSVYKVRRISDQCVYALKKVKIAYLKDKERANALNQIRILASISSQFIITYKEAFFDQQLQLLCIVMEWANQGDLLKKITEYKERKKQLPESQIWKAAYHILSGLRILHGASILHRDLKSANIFISNGIYKLGDLNVSKVNDNQQRLVNTQTGTPYYASPEIWRDQPYGSQADIWSFGCILYEMCCFRPPFMGKDLNELYHNVQRGYYEKIPQIYSKQLQELVNKCLMPRAIDRPTSQQLMQVGGTVQVTCEFYSIKVTQQDTKTIHEQLLSTIKMPNDMKKLNGNLPNAKYQSDNKAKLNDIKTDKITRKVQQKQSPLVMKSNELPSNSNRYNSCLPSHSDVLISQAKIKSTVLPLPERIKNHLNSINRKANERLMNRRPVVRQKLISSISQHHRQILDQKIQNFSLLNKDDNLNKKRPFSCNYRVRNNNPKAPPLERSDHPNTAIIMNKYNKMQLDGKAEYIKITQGSHLQNSAKKIDDLERHAGYLRQINEKYRCRSANHRQNYNPIYSELQRRLEVRQQNMKPLPPSYKLNKDVYQKQRYQSKSEVSLNEIKQRIYSSVPRPHPKCVPSYSKVPNPYSQHENNSYLQQIQNKILSSANPKARKCDNIFSSNKRQWQSRQNGQVWDNYRV